MVKAPYRLHYDPNDRYNADLVAGFDEFLAYIERAHQYTEPKV